jgi:hypothetical protein
MSGQKPITLLEVVDDPRWELSWNAQFVHNQTMGKIE